MFAFRKAAEGFSVNRFLATEFGGESPPAGFGRFMTPPVYPMFVRGHRGRAELCGFAAAHGGKACLTEEVGQSLSRLRLRFEA